MTVARTPPQPVGLIAGSGRLPFLVARGVRKAGRPLFVVALQIGRAHV